MVKIIKNTNEKAIIEGNHRALQYIGLTLGGEKAHRGMSLESSALVAKEILQEKLLPHIGEESINNAEKAHFVAYMAKKLLLTHIQELGEGDKDHIGRKRVDLAGDLLESLFTILFKGKFIDQAQRYIEKQPSEMKQEDVFVGKAALVFDYRVITFALSRALATGNWSMNGIGDTNRTGVSQTLVRETSYFSSLAYMRKVVTPLPFQTKNTSARLLHNTYYGFLCPSETPEGERIGLIKHLSLLCRITRKTEADRVKFVLNLLIGDGTLIAYNDTKYKMR